MPNIGDELHHTGWNACSSCKGDLSSKHKYLILPSLKSGRIYVVDVQSDPENPNIHKTVEPEEISKGTQVRSFPQTSHCLSTGDIMISLMGKNGKVGGDSLYKMELHSKLKEDEKNL